MKSNLWMLVVAVLLWSASVFAAEGSTRILFDQGHNQRFVIEESGYLHLSKLAEILRVKSSEVVSTTKQLNDETLKDTAALVISGPFESLRPEEVDAVGRFIEGGGRVAVMLHIGPPLAGLLTKLDLDHSNAVLHERKNIIDSDINFRVTDLSSSPLFAGLSQFSMYGGWALDPGKTATAIAKTSPEAWADLDGDKKLSTGDAIASFNVVVSGTLGAGSFIVFGDDAIFQNKYLDENNSKLAANLADWLSGR